MTKKEFKRRSVEKSGLTENLWDEEFIVLPCNCGEDSCHGWAKVINDEFCIETHRGNQ